MDVTLSIKQAYQKLPNNNDIYLAYVVAIKDPLNIHLDIFLLSEMEKRYATASNYNYMFISEELDKYIYTRKAYLCHLRGVEIISNEHEKINTKEAYNIINNIIIKYNGWVLVSTSDIDIYNRILINIYDIITKEDINKKLLETKSQVTGENIAKQ